MVRHIWSLVCKESKIEQETNNISIIDAYESLQFNLRIDPKVNPENKPIGLPFNFEIVSLFYRDKKGTEDTIQESVTVLDPKSDKLGEFSANVTFKEDQDRVRSRIKFNTIALTTSGTYLFQISTSSSKSDSKKQVATIPIEISVKVNDKIR